MRHPAAEDHNMFVCCMFLELGFWSCLELDWTWTFLELFLSWGFGPSCCHLLYLSVCACAMWSVGLLLGLLWMGSPTFTMDVLFQKGSAQLSYQDWLITPRIQKTTPPRNFLSLWSLEAKVRSYWKPVANVWKTDLKRCFSLLLGFVWMILTWGV